MAHVNWLDLLVAFMPFLFALAGALYRWLVSLLPSAKRAEAEHLTAVFVSAVEQAFKGLPGPDKKAQVLQLVQDTGLKVDPKLVDAFIESAVSALPPRA